MSKGDKPPITTVWDGRGFRPYDPDSGEAAHAFKEGSRFNAILTTQGQVIWDGTMFVPADMGAVEMAERTYVQGAVLDGKFTRPHGTEDKRAGLLRWWWAGLGLLHENIDDERWPTKRKLHNLILEELGFTEKIWRIDGTYRLVVDSVAIDNMEDDAFDNLFEKARAFCVLHWGFDPWETWKEEQAAKKANQGHNSEEGHDNDLPYRDERPASIWELDHDEQRDEFARRARRAAGRRMRELGIERRA